MAVVSTRYAEALLNSASDKEKVEFGEYLDTLATLYLETEFKETIDNPRVTKEVKLEIVKEVVPKNQVFINFIELLLNEGRINLIADINTKYTEMMDRINKRINIKIISSCELTDKEAKEIAEKYKAMYEANSVSYETKVDESLIGGIKVIAGDKVYDDTVRTKLNEML